ncbi:hypothetical protein M0P98_05395 [bacterium]|nr:hypothetical protein [bacterium]
MERLKFLRKSVMLFVLSAFIFSTVNGFSKDNNNILSTKRTSSMLVKSMDTTPGYVLFQHNAGKETVINISFLTYRTDIQARVYEYPLEENRQIGGATFKIEEETASPVKTGLLWSDEPNKKLYNCELKILSEVDTGLYVASLEGNESLVVKTSSTDKIALYCPDGFWSAMKQSGLTNLEEGVPYYFYVPANIRNLELLLGRPHTIKNSEGEIVLNASSNKTGVVTIPVKRKEGIWSIEPAFYGSKTLGVSPPSFARLLNVEPIVSFGDPKRLPIPSKKLPLKRYPQLSTRNSLKFIPGITGSALNLSGNKAVSFDRGKSITEGGYTFFPKNTGTIEFWFKPDWSSCELPISKTPFTIKQFLRSPHINLNYLYGGKHWNRNFYSDLQIQLLTDETNIGISNIGRQENNIFLYNQWVHLAYTWDIMKVSEVPVELPSTLQIKGTLDWPNKWRIFGPVNTSDKLIPTSVLNSYPDKIVVEGKTLEGVDIEVTNTLYDFPDMLKKEPTGKSAYIFLTFNSATAQEVTFGMGADWWMQAWVNGKLVHDSTETSNIYFPFSIWNHLVTVKVNKGKNILAVRFLRGGGSELALGGPDQLRTTPMPPKPGEIQKPADGIEGKFNIFVNGKKLENTRGLIREPFLVPLDGWRIFNPSTQEKNVIIGPLEGSIDNLRISDRVRYNEDFVPETGAPELDKNTRALFFFDGNLKGVSAFTKEPIVGK